MCCVLVFAGVRSAGFFLNVFLFLFFLFWKGGGGGGRQSLG